MKDATLNGLDVVMTSETHEIYDREVDPDDEYDRLGTMTTHTIKAVKLYEGSAAHHLSDVMTPDLDIKAGDLVYLVVVRYSTGDSFGFDEGRGCELAGAFRDEATAERLAHIIQLHYRLFGDAFSWRSPVERKRAEAEFQDSGGTVEGIKYPDFRFNMKLESGMFPVLVAWTGYFERLDLVSVAPFKIQPGDEI